MLHVITGPPCSGKTTYVRENAKGGDLIVDFDEIAISLGGNAYAPEGAIKEAAIEARKAAIQVAVNSAGDSWIIDTIHEKKIQEKEELIELDPGYETCMERAKQDGRPQQTFDAIEKWYSGRKGKRMNHLYKSFEVKADEAGKISGYFSTYDRIPDCYGDVIAAGAFTDTIKARIDSGHPFPLCWNHDLDQIVGSVDPKKIEDTEKGPLMEADFFNTPLAQEKREIVKSGVVYQFSFAYDVLEAGPVELEDGVTANELRKLDLFEISIVPIPANQNAVMTEVKSEEAEKKEIATVTVKVVPELDEDAMDAIEKRMEKAGRRNRKSDEDIIKQIISLANQLLDDEANEADDPDKGEDEAKANGAPEEPEQSNPMKEKLLEYIKSLEMEG